MAPKKSFKLMGEAKQLLEAENGPRMPGLLVEEGTRPEDIEAAQKAYKARQAELARQDAVAAKQQANGWLTADETELRDSEPEQEEPKKPARLTLSQRLLKHFGG